MIAKTADSKSRFLAFKDFPTALTCKSYMVKYKLKYGNWPDFNLTRKTEEFIKYNTEYNHIKHIDVERSIELYTVKYEESEAMMLLSLIGMLYCVKFDVIEGPSKHNLAISAEEADATLDHEDIMRNFKACYTP
jgi:hypothetical protein